MPKKGAYFHWKLKKQEGTEGILRDLCAAGAQNKQIDQVDFSNYTL
jgi:hypothetical protein